MVDTPANQAPVETSVIAHVYARAGGSPGQGFVKIPANQFAHAVGFDASDRGTLPVIDAAGDYGNLPMGSALQLLRVNVAATGLEYASVNPSALAQIDSQTVSSPVAAVLFDDIAASGYSKFILVGTNVVSATAATSDTLYIQVSTDNGATFKTTSGDYYDSTNARTYLASPNVPGNTSTFKHGYFEVNMFGLGNASRATSARWDFANGISTTNIPNNSVVFQSTRAVAEADNAIRASLSSGANFAIGSKLVLYGVLET